ncbi:hypothetical protein OH76DRAFT_1405321 [Lentinus brumalis]|uniref:Uncharacterized protein n=1 Tax=Lentinus brumalis TaxID=2498619 RepID=A0A371D685_9APHY|nr:hypothetical protein OH76DRAFT_1405321 [Polyporus brumalis]
MEHTPVSLRLHRPNASIHRRSVLGPVLIVPPPPPPPTRRSFLEGGPVTPLAPNGGHR